METRHHLAINVTRWKSAVLASNDRWTTLGLNYGPRKAVGSGSRRAAIGVCHGEIGCVRRLSSLWEHTAETRDDGTWQARHRRSNSQQNV